MKNHSLQLWVLNLCLKGKRSGQNTDLSYEVVGTCYIDTNFHWWYTMRHFFVQMKITKDESLFWKYSIFFWRVLGTVWEQSTKKSFYWIVLFLYSVKMLLRFSKQLEKVPSFSWPDQPQREMIQLKRLKVLQNAITKPTRRKMTPTFLDILCMIYMERQIKCEHNTPWNWSLY